MSPHTSDPRSRAFRTIARCIDTIVTTEAEIRDVSLGDDPTFSGDALRVRFVMGLPGLSGLASMDLSLAEGDLSVTDDGTPVVEFTVDVPLDDTGASAPADPTADEDGEQPIADGREDRDPIDSTAITDGAGDFPGTPEADGSAPRSTADATVQSPDASGRSIEADSSETCDGANTNADDTEAYKDPERLRAVYEEYDTFPEMRDALDADVTPQTIRRHMIKHGIHEVSSNLFQKVLNEAQNDAG